VPPLADVVLQISKDLPLYIPSTLLSCSSIIILCHVLEQ